MWTPATAEDYLTRWELTPDGDTRTTPSSVLVPVTFEGRAAVLKLARIDEEARGNGVLAWWHGAGAARVWRADEHAAVLERAAGGTLSRVSLAGDDDAATAILCSLARTLHGNSAVTAPPVGLMPLNDWFRELCTLADGRPDAADGLWRRAAELATALLADESQVVVLHGDLHHDNVLDFGDQDWRAIDPKGVQGNRLFDYTVLLRNPTHEIAATRLQRRAEIIADAAQAPIATVLEWAVASMALSAAWSTRDGDDDAATASLELARAAERLLRSERS